MKKQGLIHPSYPAYPASDGPMGDRDRLLFRLHFHSDH